MNAQLTASDMITRYTQLAFDTHASAGTETSLLRWRIQLGDDAVVWLIVHNDGVNMGYTVSTNPFWTLAHPEDISTVEQAVSDMARCIRFAGMAQ